MQRFLLVTILVGVTQHAAILAAAETKPDEDFFTEKIQPILSGHCYKCHSKNKRKGGLALDSSSGLRRGGDGGVVIVAGEPEQSRLIQAVRGTDPDFSMPPLGKLTPQQIADLVQWVKMGASDPRDGAGGQPVGIDDPARAHWAYQPVAKPRVPQVADLRWVKTPVDAFILAKLDSQGMKPSPPASKETLLRRATFDLIGMPPTTAELKAFLADSSPGAFAKVVDRLLESRHYGERWGRHWLDTARYADTHGGMVRVSNTDYRLPYAAVYRDWVIQAFNEDKPYTEFIIEQLAADKLPPADDNTALAALGFLTVGKRFNNPNDVINDRIDVVTKGFLGLTVTCARCHDHSFDPIPTADYYSLHGIFNSIEEPTEKPLINSKSNSVAADYATQVTALETKNRSEYYRTVEKYGSLFRQKAGAYMLVAGLYGTRDPEIVRRRPDAIARHGLATDLLESGGGAWMRARQPRDPVWGPLVRFERLRPSEFATEGRELARSIADQASTDRTGGYNPCVAALFKDSAPKSFDEVVARYNKLFSELDADARNYLRAAEKPGATSKDLQPFDPALIQLLDIPIPIVPSSEITIASMRDRMNQSWPILTDGKARILEIVNAKNRLDLTHPGAPKQAGVVQDVASPKDSPIFVRGQSQVKGSIVPRRFLEVLSGRDRPRFVEGSGRLELARAIADRNNPLTARVAVNRVWMHHFGEGFVPTPDDLGVQSEPPSHSELLDWLATYFMDNGWSFKKLHRLILLSNVYQQGSQANADYADRDPHNRYLWRANLRRLDFESLRDSLLVFSGALDPTVGGLPVNITDEPYSYRRTIYGYIDRADLPELLQQFDFSDPTMTTSKRASTIVPPQALFLMNSPMVIDVAQKIVARSEFTMQDDDDGRITALYRIIFQRDPNDTEAQLGRECLDRLPDQELALAAASRPATTRRPAPPRRRAADSGRGAVQNQGQLVARRPLTKWELYAQALLFANEVAFVW